MFPKLNLVVFLILTLILSSCNNHKIKSIAKQGMNDVIEENYGGGSGIRIEINDYEQNSFDQSYEVELKADWQSPFCKKKKYIATGILTVTEGGYADDWRELSTNNNLEDLISSIEQVHIIAKNSKGKISSKYDRWGSESSVRTEVDDMEFNHCTNKYEIEVEYSWQGSINASNIYSVYGILHHNKKTKETSFEVTGMNSTMTAWLSKKSKYGIGIGAVLALGVIASN